MSFLKSTDNPKVFEVELFHFMQAARSVDLLIAMML
jgi:hypothetical protein